MFVCWLLSWYVFGMLTPQLCIRDALWQAAPTTAAIATLCTCNCSTLWSLFAYRYTATCTACSGGATSYGCCDYFGHHTVTNDHLSQCRAQNSCGQFNLPQSIQLTAVYSTCRQSIQLAATVASWILFCRSWVHELVICRIELNLPMWWQLWLCLLQPNLLATALVQILPIYSRSCPCCYMHFLCRRCNW